MGWQGRDPSTDFRGAGFISLENLLFFAKTFSEVLKSTRTQLERELVLDDVMRIEDMPSYNLLC
nr:unnamed protein product [Digitaria exilis]